MLKAFGALFHVLDYIPGGLDLLVLQNLLGKDDTFDTPVSYLVPGMEMTRCQ